MSWRGHDIRDYRVSERRLTVDGQMMVTYEMTAKTRGIGPVGTAVRVAGGLGLLYLAVGAGGPSAWGVEWYDPVIGFVALPAITVLLGLAARRFAGQPVRLDGALGTALNVVVIVALVANPYTGGGAILFYGATLLVAAWRGQAGCEATVLPNLILGRDDQIGCPTLSPIDAVEAQLRAGTRRPPRDEQAAHVD
jgi:hypothetical protein